MRIGFAYTAFGIIWGPYGGRMPPQIDAYRLLPQSMYAGDTTLVYYDKKAIEAGHRERGDHIGLIVAVRGELMVCAERVRFILDLPGTCPLSLAEAKDYDERHRSSGWRALWFEGREPEWFSLSGHPVAVYRSHRTLGNDHAVLLWRRGAEIHELAIAKDVPLEPQVNGQNKMNFAVPVGQMALF
jgi:hypothetical protein